MQRDEVPAELRDPRGGTSAIEWMTPGRPVRARWDAQNAMEKGYRASWLVNRAVNIVADTVSALPFRAGPNPDEHNNFNTNAPLARLLGPPPGNPNLEWSAREMWRSAIINYLVAGRFAWEIDAAAPSETGYELWPLVSAVLNPVVEVGRRNYFAGFQYVPRGMTEMVEFTRDEVVYGYRKSPDNPREPESALQALALNVDVMVQVDQYSYAFLKNDAKPATMVIHAPIADPDARRAFQRQWQSDFRGPMNANKTGFVEIETNDDGSVSGGVEIKQVGSTNKDSQIVQIYQQHMQAVSAGLGVPMSLLDASGRTFDNASQEAKNYYELTIMPLVSEISDIINRELAPKVGNEVGWFDLSHVEALKPHLSPGVNFTDVKADLLVDERRSFAGLGPVDKQALQDEKQQAVEAAQAAFMAQQPPAPATPAASAPAGKDPAPAQKETVNGPGPASAPAAAKSNVVPFARKTRAELADERINGARSTSIAHLERTLKTQLEYITARSEKAALSRAVGKRGKQMLERGEASADAVYDTGFWQAETRAAFIPLYAAAASAAAATLADLVDTDVDTQEWAEARADALAADLIALRHTGLGLGLFHAGESVDQDELVRVIRQVHADDTVMNTHDIAQRAFDDAVVLMSGVPRDNVKTLLGRLAAGTINLDAAMKELVP